MGFHWQRFGSLIKGNQETRDGTEQVTGSHKTVAAMAKLLSQCLECRLLYLLSVLCYSSGRTVISSDCALLYTEETHLSVSLYSSWASL